MKKLLIIVSLLGLIVFAGCKQATSSESSDMTNALAGLSGSQFSSAYARYRYALDNFDSFATAFKALEAATKNGQGGVEQIKQALIAFNLSEKAKLFPAYKKVLGELVTLTEDAKTQYMALAGKTDNESAYEQYKIEKKYAEDSEVKRASIDKQLVTAVNTLTSDLGGSEQSIPENIKPAVKKLQKSIEDVFTSVIRGY